MGNIVGDIFGGATNIAGGYAGADAAMKGYDYLSNNPNEQSYMNNGGAANNAIAALLGTGGTAAQKTGAQNAFKNYLGSTGYNFNLQQGQNAINGNAAARGILNSGATGKALTSYGQGLASNYFNNYIGQLSGLAGAGQTALGQVGDAATQGGIAGGKYISSGYSNAANDMTDLGSGLFGGSIFGGF
jgi:hypothetical protein